MYQSNDRLINLLVGAVVMIVFLLIGRLKRSLRKPPSKQDRSADGASTLLKN